MESSYHPADIIPLLEKRPALWRKEDMNFHNRDVRRRLLEEISKATGISVGTCTTRIKSLKDRMRICIAKLPKTKTGSPDFSDTSAITWSSFKRLLFMKDQFTSRHATGQPLSQMEQIDPADDSATIEAEADAIDDLHSNSPMSPNPIPEYKPILVSAPKRLSRDEPQKQLLDTCSIKKPKLDCHFNMMSDSETSESAKTKDDLYYFVLDIANDLRIIQDPMVKIQTKSKIRRVVEEAVMQDLRSRPSEHVPDGKSYYVVYNNSD